ncbi:hypothetical protein NDU88_010876 [Pleurodeles waltl]|uniref:Uncharacterized protein n=1 Tax=Pleurodeles waltl TaxID=8319 RepID=A0AAV7QWZ2_PLEWA|nr:hypothetical protein NDU88_010876 [Pleurodeles waltl]
MHDPELRIPDCPKVLSSTSRLAVCPQLLPRAGSSPVLARARGRAGTGPSGHWVSPCCSRDGGGGVSPIAVPLLPFQVPESCSRPTGHHQIPQPGPDLPRGPRPCSLPEGTAGGRGPSRGGGPPVLFSPSRPRPVPWAGWADGGVSASRAAPASPHAGAVPLTWCLPPRSGSRRHFGNRDPPGYVLGSSGPPAATSVCSDRHRRGHRSELSPAGCILQRPPSFSPLPGIGRTAVRARDAGSPLVRFSRLLVGPQGHRGV